MFIQITSFQNYLLPCIHFNGQLYYSSKLLLSSVVTSTLLNFVRMFNKAHEENCKQLEQEMKKLAENEKLKMNASQNESKSLLQTSIQNSNVK